MRPIFDEQLSQLHTELISMGSLCEQAISLCIQAMEEGKNGKATAKKVFPLEYEIDQKEQEIENRCMLLLLQQQPDASDLRTVSAALKMISDMERIGDQAADIAELIPYITENSAYRTLPIEKMARIAADMVTGSVNAFVKQDLSLARQVILNDDQVDTLFDTIRQDLIRCIIDKKMDPLAVLDLLMIAKYLERIGDHAVNVAEWVEYCVTGIHESNEHHAVLSDDGDSF